MKITGAAIKQQGDWLRLFITIDGAEYQVPFTKPVFLLQGVAELPEGYEPEGARTFAPLGDLGNENSGVPIVGTDDPVFVEIVRRATMDPERAGAITVPGAEEAQAAQGTYGLGPEGELIKAAA